jgi:hypothetical protein
MDKEFWAAIASDDYRIPEGHTLENLTEILFAYLNSPNPELRDEIAYIIYAQWLKRERYTNEMLSTHIDVLLSNLRKGIGELESDTVFPRAFSVLFLAEIVHNDNKSHFLEMEQVSGILEKGLEYLEAEEDFRGHVPVKGWAHALAHTADLLLVLGHNQNTDETDLWNILNAISSKMIHSTNHVYIHGEDERLASAVIEILRRDLLSLEKVEAWTRTFTEPDGKDWKGVYMDQERNRAFQNSRNLLRSIYMQLVLEEEGIPIREQLIRVFLEALRNLKPF